MCCLHVTLHLRTKVSPSRITYLPVAVALHACVFLTGGGGHLLKGRNYKTNTHLCSRDPTYFTKRNEMPVFTRHLHCVHSPTLIVHTRVSQVLEGLVICRKNPAFVSE